MLAFHGPGHTAQLCLRQPEDECVLSQSPPQGRQAGDREADLLVKPACTELAYLRRAAMSAEPTLRGAESAGRLSVQCGIALYD